MDLNQYFRGYAEIDLDAIYENIERMQAGLTAETKMLAVIKADGYGHGAVPIAKAIDELCYGYAIATASEGHNLRRHGIDKPIFILGYSHKSFYEQIIDDNMIPAIFTYEMAKEVSDIAVEKNAVVKVNIAIDTGMRRIGFTPNEKAIKEIADISKLPNIEIVSIFTHFAKADYADKSFANKQYKNFTEFIKKLEQEGVKIPIHQCANSAAIMEMQHTSLDLVRAGISMYGLYPSEEMNKTNIKLKPALSLYSHVVYVKTVMPGEGISYGQTFVAEKEMKVATIPLGYGDGYPRNLSNKGQVIINGHLCPILGRICMDQFMVDVTGVDVKTGDLVTLIGKEGDVQLKMDDVASLAGTFNYEFACDIGKRVPRVYKYNGEIVGTKDYYNDDYEINIKN